MVDIGQDETVTEAIIIDKLIRFNEFERFYCTEWEPRKKRDGASIDWKINSSCDGFAFQWFDEINGELKPFIRLRYIPITREDAFLVAHEIEHVIKYFDKQYLKFAMDSEIAKNYNDGDIIDLAFRIGSMFDDPIIDSFLQKEYKFKPAIFYTPVKIPDTIEKLNSSGDPTDDLTKLKQALFYSQCALQWDAIKNAKSLRKWQDLKRRYQIRRPVVRRMGEELYLMSKENGYNKLEKQKLLFGKIADKYTIDGIKLKDILYINK